LIGCEEQPEKTAEISTALPDDRVGRK